MTVTTETFTFPCKARVMTKQGCELKRVDPRCVVQYSRGSWAVLGFIRTVSGDASAVTRVLDTFINEGRMSFQLKNGEVISFSDAAPVQLKHLVTTVTAKQYPLSASGVSGASVSTRASAPVARTKSQPLVSARAGNWGISVKLQAPPVQVQTRVDHRESHLLKAPQTAVMEILSYLTDGEKKVVSQVHTSLWKTVKTTRTRVVMRTSDLPVTQDFIIKTFRSHERLTTFGIPEYPLSNEEAHRWMQVPPKYFQRIHTLCLRGCRSLKETPLKTLLRQFNNTKYMDLSDIPALTKDVLLFLPESVESLVVGVRENKRMKPKIDNLTWIRSHLKRMTAAGCDLITHIDAKISKLSNLRHFDLSGSSVAALKNLPNWLVSVKLDGVKTLTSLEISSNISRLSNLELLDLSNTEIDDAGLIHIANSCAKLRRLKISGCSKITNIGVRAVLEIVAFLEIFDFSYNWKVTFNFWESLSIRAKSNLLAVGVSHTNLVPVFIQPLSDFLYSETGKAAVCGRIPIDAVDYAGTYLRNPIDSEIVFHIF